MADLLIHTWFANCAAGASVNKSWAAPFDLHLVQIVHTLTVFASAALGDATGPARALIAIGGGAGLDDVIAVDSDNVIDANELLAAHDAAGTPAVHSEPYSIAKVITMNAYLSRGQVVRGVYTGVSPAGVRAYASFFYIGRR